MPDPLTKKDIAEIEARGGQVNLMAKIISIPVLEKIARHFTEMKQAHLESYKAAHAAKLAKLDELIKVLEKKEIDLTPVLNIMGEIQKDHARIAAEHKALMEKGDDYEEHEPCEYKLTGRRDRRGFIDIEHGLTFTPVKNDENAR